MQNYHYLFFKYNFTNQNKPTVEINMKFHKILTFKKFTHKT